MDGDALQKILMSVLKIQVIVLRYAQIQLEVTGALAFQAII
jgi:hypothetical protein